MSAAVKRKRAASDPPADVAIEAPLGAEPLSPASSSAPVSSPPRALAAKRASVQACSAARASTTMLAADLKQRAESAASASKAQGAARADRGTRRSGGEPFVAVPQFTSSVRARPVQPRRPVAIAPPPMTRSSTLMEALEAAGEQELAAAAQAEASGQRAYSDAELSPLNWHPPLVGVALQRVVEAHGRAQPSKQDTIELTSILSVAALVSAVEHEARAYRASQNRGGEELRPTRVCTILKMMRLKFPGTEFVFSAPIIAPLSVSPVEPAAHAGEAGTSSLAPARPSPPLDMAVYGVERNPGPPKSRDPEPQAARAGPQRSGRVKLRFVGGPAGRPPLHPAFAARMPAASGPQLPAAAASESSAPVSETAAPDGCTLSEAETASLDSGPDEEPTEPRCITRTMSAEQREKARVRSALFDKKHQLRAMINHARTHERFALLMAHAKALNEEIAATCESVLAHLP